MDSKSIGRDHRPGQRAEVRQVRRRASENCGEILHSSFGTRGGKRRGTNGGGMLEEPPLSGRQGRAAARAGGSRAGASSGRRLCMRAHAMARAIAFPDAPLHSWECPSATGPRKSVISRKLNASIFWHTLTPHPLKFMNIRKFYIDHFMPLTLADILVRSR